jgi:hypothetical protein
VIHVVGNGIQQVVSSTALLGKRVPVVKLIRLKNVGQDVGTPCRVPFRAVVVTRLREEPVEDGTQRLG